MTLLQLRRAIAHISADYDGATVFVESGSHEPIARAVYLFAANAERGIERSAVWITDEQSSRTDPPPDLVIVPGCIIA